MEDGDRKSMPMYIPIVPSKPVRIWIGYETNCCNPSCAKPNGVRDPAYGGVQLQSIWQHMNNIPWFDSP